ncbi:cyclase family protein [Fundidesulfovibrio putealis]|uniref:cyclase family protein n=1 Tax=Fundidesulfovibrio putealis TaxID=270496 RepID=UPI00048151DC|nr:cyclase family protein [Fundidesulfovibrio putealis]
MRLIDLTVPVADGMAGYPGDPPVSVRQIHDLPVEGWRLSEIRLGSHAGTHVNAPWHMAEDGARLEELALTHFVGRALVRQPVTRMPGGQKGVTRDASPDSGCGTIPAGVGLIYADAPLDGDELPLVLAARPPFVAQAVELPMDEAVERELCRAGIVSFENLANTSKLPRDQIFLFIGLPLALCGDGAPVRAVAMLDFA